jgi:DNA-binding NtrC family response regulator
MAKENNVLFLDDEESILNSLKRVFINESYGIVTTTNHKEALEIIGKENIKVVLSDQRMPEINGTEFLYKVKEKYPHPVRIIFTGFAEFSAAEDAINVSEVFRFISKPWDSNELKMIINQAIHQFDIVKENKEYFEMTRAKNKELEILNKKLKGMG